MQLSKFADYGLRVLVFLAVQGPERQSTAKIARKFGISEHHLSKVASALVRGGFVVSGRGRQGGLVLAKEPQGITVGAVVRHLTADCAVVECFNDTADCRIMSACGLRAPLAKAQEAFYETLDSYSLSDVTCAKSELSALLTR